MEKPHGIKAFSAVLIASSLLLPPLGEAQTQKKPAKTPVVIMDPVTQSPRIMRDIEEYVPGGEGGKLQVSQANAAKTATDYLAKNEARLGVRTADLKLRRVRKAGKFWVTTFTQHYRNIPVYKSRVGLVALGNGKIVTLGSNFDKGISLDVKPTVTFEEAVTAASSSLKLRDPQAARTTRKELVIFPNPKGQKERYSLAWRFFLATKKPDAFHFKTFFVDAHKGRVLKSHDVLVADTLKGRVTGAIWPNDPTTATSSKPFSGLQVKVKDKTADTDSQGRFALSVSPAGTYDLTLALTGPKAKVFLNSGWWDDDLVDNEAKLQGSVSTGAEGSLAWPASDQANVFYHLNRIQDWFISTFGYSWQYDLERENFDKTQIEAYCTAGALVNGLGGNGTVLFGSDSGKQWARGADIIYHEFTHNVLQEIFDDYIGFSYGSYNEGYAMDEGFADYFASALTDDPIFGENVAPSPRNLQNEDRYPAGAYNIEGHTGSEIISGACWDFRSSIDKDEADQLVFTALNILAAWPPEYYFSDPDESNFLAALRLAAAGGYQDKIDQAFANHNLLPAPEAAVPAPAPAAGPAPKVTSITPAHNQRAYGPTQVVIAFSAKIDAATLAGNVVVEREDFKGRRTVQCDIVLDSSTKKTVTVKPKATGEGFTPLGTQTNFFVRLISGETQGVRGVNGQMLDGDGDGRAGGDYQAKFWVID